MSSEIPRGVRREEELGNDSKHVALESPSGTPSVHELVKVKVTPLDVIVEVVLMFAGITISFLW